MSILSAQSAHKPDPRVLRSRTAILEAARTLFLQKGYSGTTMDDIAQAAGRTKRTVYNNFADKESLFTEMVQSVTGVAESFSDEVLSEFPGISYANLENSLQALAQRLALSIMRPQVVELRRLLIGEARSFPQLSRQYYERAPGRVLEVLEYGFDRLARHGLLNTLNGRLMAAQFAYLVVGEHLDRAVLTGELPSEAGVLAAARDGADTFLLRFSAQGEGATGGGSSKSADPGGPRSGKGKKDRKGKKGKKGKG